MSAKTPKPLAHLVDVFDSIDAVRKGIVNAWTCRDDDAVCLSEGLLTALSELHFVEQYLGLCGVTRDGPEPSEMRSGVDRSKMQHFFEKIEECIHAANVDDLTARAAALFETLEYVQMARGHLDELRESAPASDVHAAPAPERRAAS